MDIVDSIRRITDPTAPLMQPAKEYQRQEKGLATAFLMEIEQGMEVYRYDVSIVLMGRDPNTGVEFEKNFAKGPDEGLRSRNRNICYDMLVTAYKKVDQVFGFFLDENAEIVYDCKSTMYTSRPIKHLEEIVFNINDTSEYARTYCSQGEIHVKIVPNASGHTLQLDEFTQYTEKITVHQENRSIRTFLEMAIAQYGINNYTYTPIGAGKLFECEDLDGQIRPTVKKVGNGIVLRSGIAKGVRIVKGEGSGPVAALVLDVKVSAFFHSQNVIETVKEMNRGRFPENQRAWDSVNDLLQDVRVEVTFARNRTFGIRRLSAKPVREIVVQHDGQPISLMDYYVQMRGTQLNPQLRAVVPNFQHEEGSPDGYFPLEVLFIMPDQRVPLEKMSGKLSQDLLAANTLLPDERYKRVIEHCERLKLFGGNSTLVHFGISIRKESNQCKINVRAAPKIRFRDQRLITPNVEQADWKRQSVGKHFYSSDEIYNWVVLHHQPHTEDVKHFVGRFMSAAAERGMAFRGPPSFWEISNLKWDQIFSGCQEEDVQFVILIDPKNEDTHGILKYYEAKCKILTQHITYERVKDVLGSNRGRQTLENILNKTNEKYSGVNYHPIFESAAKRFDLDKNETLIIGYDVAQPPPMSATERRMVMAVRKDLMSFDPSVVGITANMASDPHNFVGDYYYQEAKREGLNYEQLADRFQWVLSTLEKARPDGASPKYIFVLRNGLSEGQFAESVSREIEALEKGCRAYRAGYKPRFVYILGTKRHFKKYYSQMNDGRARNIMPGSVIDEKFVREDCPEFFMQSHYALKGVGKPVEYNVLFDAIGLNKDELEGVLNSLCYSHQIVNSAVSIPEPIYQADELAKRGRNNYTTMKRLEQNLIPRIEHNFVDVNGLNDILTYKDSPIFICTRFTA